MLLIRPLTALFALSLLFTTAVQAAEKPSLMKNPIPAPGFTLEDMDGNTHRMEDYAGRVMVVNFWATWCPPCREEMPSMNRAWKTLKQHDIAMLGINVGEDEDTIFTFTGDYPVNFPILLDRDSSVIQAWPVRGLPTTFVVDKQGQIVYRVIGGREWDAPELVDMLIELQNR
ncbi:TlpA disulfide reductase family protein [Thiohalophilus sp.]|uniref:TlpA family protein disulfide reductase n=1 Tax=Thiohalophilus sp. TaxID=3028392 RepID=UPI002ACDA789|nr:TlpA disulfide reductase family protein [Thiohalophilus sp.]MDZ7803149.1 TlpA disulfide reductase family protein [Thiohalophilus sp.]